MTWQSRLGSAIGGKFSGDFTVGGTLTYEDVSNIDAVGIITAQSGVSIADSIFHTGDTDTAIRFPAANTFTVETGGSERVRVTSAGRVGIGTINPNRDLEVVKDGNAFIRAKNTSSSVNIDILASSSAAFVGPQSNHDLGLQTNNVERLRITSTGEVRVGSAFSVGQAGIVTAAEYHGDGSNLTGISVAISTAAATVAGIVTTLDLSSAQDHKITVSGISTVTVKGGTEGESHTVRIINSGITTVGFSTFFLFPSGADPSMPTADGAISLISFTVNRVGAGGTQLLAGAALNYS